MSPNRTSLENLFEIRRSLMFLELFRMFLAELLCFPFCENGVLDCNIGNRLCIVDSVLLSLCHVDILGA